MNLSSGERAAVALTAELLYRQKYRLSDLADPSLGPAPSPWGNDLANLLGRLAPHGWYYQEQMNSSRLYEAQLAGAFEAAGRRVRPRQVEARAHELEQQISSGRLGKGLNALVQHQILAALLLPNLSKLPFKAAIAQTTTDQAAVGCTLERHRIAEGRFPENLHDLVPRFIARLPKDAFIRRTLYISAHDRWPLPALFRRLGREGRRRSCWQSAVR